MKVVFNVVLTSSWWYFSSISWHDVWNLSCSPPIKNIQFHRNKTFTSDFRGVSICLRLDQLEAFQNNFKKVCQSFKKLSSTVLWCKFYLIMASTFLLIVLIHIGNGCKIELTRRSLMRKSSSRWARLSLRSRKKTQLSLSLSIRINCNKKWWSEYYLFKTELI